MKYLKIWTDFRDVMEALSDEEKGRLFSAMLQYAETGVPPALPGAERILWPAARRQIDRTAEEYERLRAAGQKGGRAKRSPAPEVPAAAEDRNMPEDSPTPEAQDAPEAPIAVEDRPAPEAQATAENRPSPEDRPAREDRNALKDSPVPADRTVPSAPEGRPPQGPSAGFKDVPADTPKHTQAASSTFRQTEAIKEKDNDKDKDNVLIDIGATETVTADRRPAQDRDDGMGNGFSDPEDGKGHGRKPDPVPAAAGPAGAFPALPEAEKRSAAPDTSAPVLAFPPTAHPQAPTAAPDTTSPVLAFPPAAHPQAPAHASLQPLPSARPAPPQASSSPAPDGFPEALGQGLTGLTDERRRLLDRFRAIMGDGPVRWAADTAVSRGARSWAYVIRILENLQKDGAAAPAQAEAAAKKRFPAPYPGRPGSSRPAAERDYTEKELETMLGVHELFAKEAPAWLTA